MKHFEIQANGYTFDVAIKEDSPLGAIALSVPMDELMTVLTNTALNANLNPDNIDMMNMGASQVFYSLV